MRQRKGQATVEFALALPFLVFFLMVFIYLGLFLMDYMNMTTMAREAARAASLVEIQNPSSYKSDSDRRKAIQAAYKKLGENYVEIYTQNAPLVFYRVTAVNLQLKTVVNASDGVEAKMELQPKKDQDLQFVLDIVKAVLPKQVERTAVMRREDVWRDKNL